MDNEVIITAVVSIVCSSLATTIFSKLFDFFVGKKQTIAILLLSSLEQLCDKITRQGYRTAMQTQRLTEMQKQYEKYGDGYAKSLVEAAMVMPLKLDQATA